MTNADKILKALREASGPLCDDCLTKEAGLARRQVAYTECSRLYGRGAINRVRDMCSLCRKLKLVNSALSSEPVATRAPETPPSAKPAEPQTGSGRAWSWEGNVQAAVVKWLVHRGYTIRSVANTESREAGKDIVAVGPEGRRLWVSVKGWPESSPNTQARHWFAGALFDLVLWRGEDHEVELGLALPGGYATYHNLAPRCTWLRSAMPFSIYWVSETGEVTAE